MLPVLCKLLLLQSLLIELLLYQLLIIHPRVTLKRLVLIKWASSMLLPFFDLIVSLHKCNKELGLQLLVKFVLFKLRRSLEYLVNLHLTEELRIHPNELSKDSEHLRVLADDIFYKFFEMLLILLQFLIDFPVPSSGSDFTELLTLDEIL